MIDIEVITSEVTDTVDLEGRSMIDVEAIDGQHRGDCL